MFVCLCVSVCVCIRELLLDRWAHSLHIWLQEAYHTGGELNYILWPSVKGPDRHRDYSEKADDLVEAYNRVKPSSALTKCELYKIVCSNSANICRTESFNLSSETSCDVAVKRFSIFYQFDNKK